MLTNNLVKGTRVQLANGWFATLLDNRKGIRRFMDVEGIYREKGDVYSHDIIAYVDIDGKWKTDMEYTKEQNKLRKLVEAML